MTRTHTDAEVLAMLAGSTYDEVRAATGMSRGAIYAVACRHGARKTEARIMERAAERRTRQRETLAALIDDIQTADVLDHLHGLPDDCVDLVVTSPPFNVGKSYLGSASADRVGHVVWLGWLTQVIGELGRVLKPGGTLAMEAGWTPDHNGHLVPIDTLIHDVVSKAGLTHRNRIVWEVGFGLTPRRRLAGRYSTISVATRGEPATFNPTPARTPQANPGKRAFRGPSKGELSGHPLGAFPGDVWRIPSVRANSPERLGHPAPMPEALAKRLIEVYSMPGDLVLDPFSGSGTTAAMAIVTGRRFTGCDVAYDEMRRRRLDGARIAEYCVLPGVDDAGVAVRTAEARRKAA